MNKPCAITSFSNNLLSDISSLLPKPISISDMARDDSQVELREREQKPPPQGREKDCCTYVCMYKWIAVVAVIASIALVAANALSVYDIVDHWSSYDWDKGVIAVVICGFNGLLGLLIFFSILERNWVLEHFTILTLWPGLGLFAIFLGCNTINSINGIESQSAAEHTSSSTQALRDVIIYTGWTLVGIGAWFLVMGIFGGKSMKTKK